MSVLLSKDTVLAVLRSGVPDAEWLLTQIESQHGWLRFPPYLTEIITNLKLENYPLLYSSEAAIVAMLLKGFLDEGEIKVLVEGFETASLDDRGELVEGFIEGIGSAFERMEIPKTPQQQQAARALFDKLSPEEQQQNIKVAQHFFCAFFATFYQNLSTMVHGEKLTSLVAQAQAGDDQAFVKSVQIDRRILTAIPYFRERYAKAQDAADSNFFDLLSYRQRCAPYRGKIRHKSLWLTFSILDQAGLLNTLSHREILEMCDEAGVGGFENRIQDVKHLSKRIREFREFQRRGVIATP